MTDEEIYEYLGQVFEWSRPKAVRNAFKHDVRFVEAATVFFDPEAEFELDIAHSGAEEERYTVVGRTLRSRTLFVVHMYRGERIRIISARKATSIERRQYEDKLGR